MLAIYTRLSVKDEDSNSIEHQKREGKEFAKINKFDDYKIYDEGEGVSGGLDIEDRPELLSLMNDIEKGVITTVWFRNQNRLERNSLTYAKFSTLVKTLECDVFFNSEKVDFNNPNNALHSHILSGLNQYQRELQSIQTKRVLKDNAIEGKSHGISPYGYTKDKNNYIIVDEEEADIVKRIYKMSLSGIGTDKIAKILSSENILTRYNKIGKGSLTTKHNGKIKTTLKKDIKWTGNTIRKILRNTAYKGERHLKSGVYDCPDIITPTLWQKVQKNLIKNRNNNGKVHKYDYLLKNKITCGICGKNYYGRTRQSKKDHYYMCASKRYKDIKCSNRSINIDVTEDFIWQRFFADKVLKEIIENHFRNTSTDERLSDLESEIKTINNSISDNKKKRDKAVRLVLNDVLSEEEVKSEMKILKDDKAIYEQKLSKLNEELKALETIEEDVNSMVNELSKIKANSTFAEKRQIIEKYLKNITVAYNEKGIEWNGYYWAIYFLVVDFNIPTLKREYYMLDKAYNSAYEPRKKITIPLS
ncbi:recombinase family protein, partial [Algibacter sp.]|nr:recombinase family protein [Algibacter sp.]